MSVAGTLVQVHGKTEGLFERNLASIILDDNAEPVEVRVERVGSDSIPGLTVGISSKRKTLLIDIKSLPEELRYLEVRV